MARRLDCDGGGFARQKIPETETKRLKKLTKRRVGKCFAGVEG